MSLKAQSVRGVAIVSGRTIAIDGRPLSEVVLEAFGTAPTSEPLGVVAIQIRPLKSMLKPPEPDPEVAPELEEESDNE